MPYSILLVDDDVTLLTLNSVVLKRLGYEVYSAKDGSEAIALLETIVPDVFIIDVMMPGINGFELCQRLRANNHTRNHPVILLSARGDRESIEEGMRSGANLYLKKPIGIDELASQVMQVMGK